MQCSLCHEEALPDAFICHRCGALLPGESTGGATQKLSPQDGPLLPGQAATGITQKLSPQDVVSCPSCNLPMAEGFLYNPLRSPYTWWAAGRAEPYNWNGEVGGSCRLLLSIFRPVGRKTDNTKT